MVGDIDRFDSSITVVCVIDKFNSSTTVVCVFINVCVSLHGSLERGLPSIACLHNSELDPV